MRAKICTLGLVYYILVLAADLLSLGQTVNLANQSF